MGRTVINETENKQTVILNDSPEGVKGGYFDQDMNWNVLGKSSIPADYIYSGKVFKGRVNRNTFESTIYIPAYFYAENQSGSGTNLINAGDFLPFFQLTASQKNVSLHVIHKDGLTQTDVAIINNAGNYNTRFNDFKLHLVSGIDPAFKDYFDAAFEEVEL